MSLLRRLPFLLGLCALLFAPWAWAQPATVLQESPLLHEPFSDARVVSTLSANSAVEVLKRQGGWYQVRAAQQQGWVHMSRIRLGEASNAAAVDASGLSQARQLLQTGRSGATGTTVATGIRGLDVEDLQRAQPDHQAVAAMANFQSKPDAARQYAGAARLQANSIDYLGEKK